MLKVRTNLLVLPYVSRPLEKGRAKRRIEMRRRRILSSSGIMQNSFQTSARFPLSLNGSFGFAQDDEKGMLDAGGFVVGSR